MAGFETFDLGRAIATAEGIKGMRRQSRLDDLQAQALRGNIAGQQQAQMIAASQEQRAATQFDQTQEVERYRLMNAASAEIQENPYAITRWLPKLRESGIRIQGRDGVIDFANFDPANHTPDEIQQAAAALYQSTGAALASLNPQDGPEATADIQNWEYFNRLPPEQQQRFMALKRNPTPPQVVMVNGVPTLVDRFAGTAAPLSSQEAEVAAAAEKARQTAQATAEGAADAERAATAPQRAERARQVISTIDNTMGTINSALSNINATTVGIIGSGTRLIPGSKAFDLSEQLKTIRANIGFDRLQQMRDASPTGGALGQVAVQELEALQASIASLNQAQSAGQLRKGLLSVRKSYNNWKSAVERANRSERAGGWTVTVEGG